ncbi:MAG: hypothetical protein WC841_02830 [Candidatus Shapirobacteria bacterium]
MDKQEMMGIYKKGLDQAGHEGWSVLLEREGSIDLCNRVAKMARQGQILKGGSTLEEYGGVGLRLIEFDRIRGIYGYEEDGRVAMTEVGELIREVLVRKPELILMAVEGAALDLSRAKDPAFVRGITPRWRFSPTELARMEMAGERPCLNNADVDLLAIGQTGEAEEVFGDVAGKNLWAEMVKVRSDTGDRIQWQMSRRRLGMEVDGNGENEVETVRKLYFGHPLLHVMSPFGIDGPSDSNLGLAPFLMARGTVCQPCLIVPGADGQLLGVQMNFYPGRKEVAVANKGIINFVGNEYLWPEIAFNQFVPVAGFRTALHEFRAVWPFQIMPLVVGDRGQQLSEVRIETTDQLLNSLGESAWWLNDKVWKPLGKSLSASEDVDRFHNAWNAYWMALNINPLNVFMLGEKAGWQLSLLPGVVGTGFVENVLPGWEDFCGKIGFAKIIEVLRRGEEARQLCLSGTVDFLQYEEARVGAYDNFCRLILEYAGQLREFPDNYVGTILKGLYQRYSKKGLQLGGYQAMA